MRIPRLYMNCELRIGHQLALDDRAVRYLFSVLRMREGDRLTLFNGRGGEFEAKLTQLGKRSASAELLAFSAIDRQSPLDTHLAIAISRGERMDHIIQKATELGVSSITPLFSERCEVKLQGERLQKKHNHWQQIAISACEQCQRNLLPQINQAINLNSFITNEPAGLKLVLHHRTEQSIAQIAGQQQAVTLLIGPEGGLSDDEIKAAATAGYSSVCLGPRVLRTETAPLAALSLLQARWGDF